MPSITDVMNGFTDMIHNKLAELNGTPTKQIPITGVNTSPSIAQMGTSEVQGPGLIPGRNAPVSIPPIVNFFQGAAASLNRQRRINQGLPPDEPVPSAAVSAPVSSPMVSTPAKSVTSAVNKPAGVKSIASFSPVIKSPDFTEGIPASPPAATPPIPNSNLPVDRSYILSSGEGPDTGTGLPNRAAYDKYAAEFATLPQNVPGVGTLPSPMERPGSDISRNITTMNAPGGPQSMEVIRAGGINEVGKQLDILKGINPYTKEGKLAMANALASIAEKAPSEGANRRAKEAETAYHYAVADTEPSIAEKNIADARIGTPARAAYEDSAAKKNIADITNFPYENRLKDAQAKELLSRSRAVDLTAADLKKFPTGLVTASKRKVYNETTGGYDEVMDWDVFNQLAPNFGINPVKVNNQGNAEWKKYLGGK